MIEPAFVEFSQDAHDPPIDGAKPAAQRAQAAGDRPAQASRVGFAEEMEWGTCRPLRGFERLFKRPNHCQWCFRALT